MCVCVCVWRGGGGGGALQWESTWQRILTFVGLHNAALTITFSVIFSEKNAINRDPIK